MHQKHLFNFRTLLFSWGCLFLLSSCTNSERAHTNDWTRMNIKGNIKQIDVLDYDSYQDLMQKKKGKKSFIRFDEQGLIIKQARLYESGQTHWMNYYYSGDSVWIDEVRELNNHTEHPQAHWLYVMDEYGAHKAITSILIDSSVNFHIDLSLNEYSKATELVYSQQQFPDRFPCKVVNTYDEKGILKERLDYAYHLPTQACAENATRSVFTHNDQGDIERQVMYNLAGKKERAHSYQYTYDKSGNWTQRIHYIGDAVMDVQLRTFTYY